jgi:hypothetical protein
MEAPVKGSREPLTVTVDDAVKMIGLGKTTLYKLVGEGRGNLCDGRPQAFGPRLELALLGRILIGLSNQKRDRTWPPRRPDNQPSIRQGAGLFHRVSDRLVPIYYRNRQVMPKSIR